MAKQVGPPVRRGPYLGRVIDDPESEALVQADLVVIPTPGTGGEGDRVEAHAEVIYVTDTGIQMVGGGTFVPHDVLLVLLKTAGII